jgi:hypothetical protein
MPLNDCFGKASARDEAEPVNLPGNRCLEFFGGKMQTSALRKSRLDIPCPGVFDGPEYLESVAAGAFSPREY